MLEYLITLKTSIHDAILEKKKIQLVALWCIGMSVTSAQNVTIAINATQNKRLVSPYIYGRDEDLNNSLHRKFIKDAGPRFVAEDGEL